MSSFCNNQKPNPEPINDSPEYHMDRLIEWLQTRKGNLDLKTMQIREDIYLLRQMSFIDPPNTVGARFVEMAVTFKISKHSDYKVPEL